MGGGDLWAPSSQAEYDDLMEREGAFAINIFRFLIKVRVWEVI